MISTTMYDYVHTNANNIYCMIPASDINGQLLFSYTKF